jgi:hypothetical protein
MKSLLAEALMGQEKFAEAEPLLLDAYHGMKSSTLKAGSIQSARSARDRLTEAIERLIAFYEATGKPDEAAKWKTELEARKKGEQNP